MQTVNDLDGYLGAGFDGTGLSTGALVCVIALLVWLLTIAKEINACVAFMRGVLSVPRGATVISAGDEDSPSAVHSLSRRHCCGVLAVQSIRLGIAGLMLYYGALYIIHTPSVPDLLLNAVALEIIISIDEIVYEALVPRRYKRFVSNMAGLPLAPVRWKDLDVQATATLAVVFTLLAAFVAIFIIPQQLDFLSARDALCSGDLDFVVTLDGAGVSSWSYPEGTYNPSQPMYDLNPRNYPNGEATEKAANDTGAEDKPSLLVHATLTEILLRQHGRRVLEPRQPGSSFWDGCDDTECFDTTADALKVRKPGRDDCCLAKQHYVPGVVAGPFSIDKKFYSNVEESLRFYNPWCYDVADIGAGYDNLIGASLSGTINTDTGFAECPNNAAYAGTVSGNALSEGWCPSHAGLCVNGTCVTPSCALVKQHCGKSGAAGERVRQMCPHTCGCDDPRGDLVLSLPVSGCGHNCVRSGRYLERLASLPCEDVSQDDPTLVAYLDNWDRSRRDWPKDWNWPSVGMIEGLRLKGCAFLADRDAMLAALNESSAVYRPNLVFVNLCVEQGNIFPIKPLSYFCPVACGCHAGDPHCPLQCPVRTATSPICPSAQRDSAFNPIANGTCPQQDSRRFWV